MYHIILRYKLVLNKYSVLGPRHHTRRETRRQRRRTYVNHILALLLLAAVAP